MLWNIHYEDGSYAGFRNSGETETQAVAEWNDEQRKPLKQIRYHEELLQRGTCDNFRVGRSLKADRTGMGNVLFCDFHPEIRPATSAIRMREIWIDAGYAKVPYVEIVE